MTIALWIVAIVLALLFAAAGTVKLAKPKEELKQRMSWVEDVSPNTIRLIGATEVLGALGLILPAVTGIATVLVPLAAVGLAVVMVLATVVHLRRGAEGAAQHRAVPPGHPCRRRPVRPAHLT